MSSDSMLIHAGARQLEEHLLRRPRLARTPCPFVHDGTCFTSRWSNAITRDILEIIQALTTIWS
jgi:hypothetical protein